MGGVVGYCAQLRKLDAWDASLLQESRLLGPRANLGLAYAVFPPVFSHRHWSTVQWDEPKLWPIPATNTVIQTCSS